MERVDVAVIGAGHNGLVAALLLARAGRKVAVLERADVVGGAARTERPFARAPRLGASTGAYLLGLMPPELIDLLDITIPTVRRDPHYFLPSLDDGYLLLGADEDDNDRQLRERFSDADVAAHHAMQRELAAMREGLAPAWLADPLSVEDTADRHIPAEHREAFVDLVRGPVGSYLDRFGFTDPLLPVMYAVTDGFSGLHGGWDTPGSGHNFLVHNMGRLPGSDATWMIVRGGMGTVTQELAARCVQAGVRIHRGSPVREVLLDGQRATGVALDDGTHVAAGVVLGATDPWTLRDLAHGSLGTDLDGRLAEWARKPGLTLKLNLALRDLPTFTCLPESRGQHGTTTHILPVADDLVGAVRKAFAQATHGHLPDDPTIEIYLHSAVDDSIRDESGHHSGALFVQWVPNRVNGSTWEAEADAYADHLLGLVDRYAPGFSDLVVDRQVLHPQAIEDHFGIRWGHIHHVDNTVAFDQRMPYRTPIEGLWACGAGCHPAGSVIGAAGHNAAQAILQG